MSKFEKTEPKPVAIITGASAGIGLAAAKLFLKNGYVVVAAARRLEAMQELEQRGAVLHALDLKDPASISVLVNDVLETHGRVDVLINSAGYGAYGSVEETPMSVARAQIEVNLFGLAEMIQAVLPTMREQRSGKIINISSVGGKTWSPLGGWYHASKFAVEGLSDCLRNEVRQFGIDVVIVQPAGVKTEWAGIAIDHMKATSGSGPYRKIVEAATPIYAGDVGSATPEIIADGIFKAATARHPKARYKPHSARMILRVRSLLNDRWFDWLVGKIFHLPSRLPA